MLSTVDDRLKTNNEDTASRLKAKLLEHCTNFFWILLTMIKRLENHCSSVILYPVIYKFVQSCRVVPSVTPHYISIYNSMISCSIWN